MSFAPDTDHEAGQDACNCTPAPSAEPEKEPASYIQRIADCVRRVAFDATAWDEEMRNREGWVAGL